MDGEVVAKFVGIREEGELRLAAVEIAVDCSVTIDLTEVMEGMDEPPPDDEEGEMIMPEIESFLEETTREGTGLLLWNVERGMLHSLELTCEVTETQTMAMLMILEEFEESMEQVSVMSGSETYEVRFTE